MSHEVKSPYFVCHSTKVANCPATVGLVVSGLNSRMVALMYCRGEGRVFLEISCIERQIHHFIVIDSGESKLTELICCSASQTSGPLATSVVGINWRNKRYT